MASHPSQRSIPTLLRHSMAAVALCGAAAAQSFSSGDLCIASGSLSTGGGFTPGISRVSPITGTATLVRPLNTIVSNLVFDPFRGNVIVRCKPTVASTSGLWAFDAAGNGTLLASDAVLSSNETEISVGLGGRIYLMNISTLRLRYIEPDLTIHDVLDAAGTAPYVVAGPNPGSVRAFYFDPATSTILTSSYGPAVCGPVTATSPYVTRVQLTAGGGQVAGASMTVPICLSVTGGSGGDVHDANEFNAGPNGSVYLSFDNNSYVTLGRMITIDPTTLAWSTFATTSTYFGVPASNAGCYSSALNRGVLLDTFNNVLRLYLPGSGGEGTALASGDLISSNLGSGEAVSMIEVPLGTAAGLSSYGTGTPGCAGPQIMSATTAPSITAPDFALVTTACPPSSLGVLVFTDAADFPGSDPFFLGVTLHVSFAAATQVGALDIVSNTFGLASSGNLPIAPALLGQTFYAQSIWAWTGCSTPSPYALSSSNGLALTVQP